MALEFKYVTHRPAIQWKVQLTDENRKEIFALIQAVIASATEVDGVIEWKYGVFPERSYRLAVGEWLLNGQSAATNNLTQLSTSKTEPLLDNVLYQPVPSEFLKFVIQEGE